MISILPRERVLGRVVLVVIGRRSDNGDTWICKFAAFCDAAIVPDIRRRDHPGRGDFGRECQCMLSRVKPRPVILPRLTTVNGALDANRAGNKDIICAVARRVGSDPE